MGRWEPDAPERLVRAALELFDKHGYENTTVVEIAKAAGLTKSTFFRHFPDKREVLFAGQDIMCRLLADGIAAAPTPATPMTAISAALDAVSAAFPESRRDIGPLREDVIARTNELRERDAFKQASIQAAMADALRDRGVPERAATLAAELGVLAICHAYTRWVAPANDREFADLAHEELAAFQAATTDLDADLLN